MDIEFRHLFHSTTAWFKSWFLVGLVVYCILFRQVVGLCIMDQPITKPLSSQKNMDKHL